MPRTAGHGLTLLLPADAIALGSVVGGFPVENFLKSSFLPPGLPDGSSAAALSLSTSQRRPLRSATETCCSCPSPARQRAIRSGTSRLLPRRGRLPAAAEPLQPPRVPADPPAPGSPVRRQVLSRSPLWCRLHRRTTGPTGAAPGRGFRNPRIRRRVCCSSFPVPGGEGARNTADKRGW